MKKLLLLTLSLLFTATIAIAQEITMNDGRISTCQAIFTDSGGSMGDYAASEDFTLTFCSPFSTDQVQATFTSWNVGAGAILLVYDNDAAIGSPIGVFNSATVPTVIASSPGNTTGCLTFRFLNPGANTSAGWTADLSCVDNCQSIVNSVTIVPAVDSDGILRACQDEVISFTGTTTFSIDGAGAINEWVFSDDPMNPVAGTSISRSFSDPGIYTVDYITTDSMGCRDRIIEDLVIYISTTPDFAGTLAMDTSICFGESTIISGLVTTTEFVSDVAPPISDVQLQLGDGNTLGVPFESCINVTDFPPGATVQNASDIVSFFANMEHSYLGDVTLELESPNGTIITVIQYPNVAGGTYLGVPVDVEATPLVPGVGFLYNFTEAPSATQTFNQASAGLATLPAGDYRTENPFSDLIGSPLNGDWCLRFIDDLNLDNGFLFEWGINFNPAIVPSALRFKPNEVGNSWTTNSDVIATNGSDITVMPTMSGQNCYDFTLTDDFGCTYTETVCIDVAPEITSVQPADIIVCQNTGSVTVDLTAKDDEIRNGLVATDYDVTYFNSDADAQADTNPILTPDAFAVTTSTTVWARVFDNVNSCFKTEQVNVTFQEVNYNTVADLELCDDLSADQVETFDLTSQIAGILGSQSAADFNIAFFNSQADADANTGAITTPAAYDNVSNPEAIYVRVSNAQDQDCYQTGQFNIEVLSAPSIGAVSDVSDCATNPITNQLDLVLADYDAAVLNGQSAAAYTITYYNSEANAQSGASALSSPYASTDQETIYARITDNATGCFDYTSFNITVEVCEVVIPEGFSPNNDGINDTFSIPNLQQYPNFELTVFNRNGSTVYETKASNYEEFAGVPNKGALAGDGLLPVGTYFYVIKYNDAETEDVASWVYINY
ncbi:T9SS type B sorting domain-containing protein [Nonlabens ulvanivorans]|uniref:T9SS type B sorting domain-containing protein n=2 Tax=Nonlabens ulvanivorans TaxID=906888 RepID=UPI0029435709|nr:gliding motility-associated C-terminal domain-containing protein [Nonlabens ulvanivorans]WOI22886.1 gliding motility-associated C-terminal domain-containing protein [Nonlabens ulvanivorans]